MCELDILHDSLYQFCPELHLKRLNSLTLACHALLDCKTLTLTELGRMKWSTKTGHRVRVFSSIDFPIRLVVTHHYIRAVLVRCNIQRYSPLLRELHR
ncbi:TPA: hypothetical protein JXT89_004516 [Escherichia coli]|nr:hypothetical protein [Escherichia coli]